MLLVRVFQGLGRLFAMAAEEQKSSSSHQYACQRSGKLPSERTNLDPYRNALLSSPLRLLRVFPEFILRRSVDLVNHVSFRGKLNESMQLKVT